MAMGTVRVVGRRLREEGSLEAQDDGFNGDFRVGRPQRARLGTVAKTSPLWLK
jgi:hypothetical protein